MSNDETPAYALAKIPEQAREAIRLLMNEEYREVMFQLDRIRESCAWVEKMMWRRVNQETATRD